MSADPDREARALLNIVADELRQEALNRNWCNQYDEFVRRVNKRAGEQVLKFVREPKPRPEPQPTPDAHIDVKLLTDLMAEANYPLANRVSLGTIFERYLERIGLVPNLDSMKADWRRRFRLHSERPHRGNRDGAIVVRLDWWPYTVSPKYLFDDFDEEDDDGWVTLDTVTIVGRATWAAVSADG